ncbi:MAG: MATE family efflux transporter [Clostridia bacterium]|nr:MATE family efflux transporter [Clostridia bacterium]
MKKNYEINMCEGPLLPKLVLFALPLMLSSILQLLYNAADIIVVGKFAGSTALAAVSSTGSLINLIVNLFIGLSVGTNVAVARYFGAKDDQGVTETVHTSITLSVIGGIGVGLIGFFGSRTFLGWMASPPDVIDQAALYLKIYFLGLPASMLYNFGAAILRAIGDTRRPLVFLTISGLANVLLNLLLVIGFDMGVAGVAIGTIASQAISAVMVIVCLLRAEGTAFQLRPSRLCIKKDKFAIIARTGIPAGVQGALFSVSNVLIQSSINSFGSVAMAGNGAASNLEGFIYVAMNAFHQASVTFSSQNLGARQWKRIQKTGVECSILVCVIGFTLGVIILGFGPQLLSIYDSDPAVIEFGLIRMRVIALTYFTCGLMEVMCGMLRGIGYSVAPMIISLMGACGLRIIWIYTIFRVNHTLVNLYISYPVSWITTTLAHFICFMIVFRRLKKRIGE